MKFRAPKLNELEYGLTKISRWVKRFLHAKKIFKKLPRVDVAVFDTHTSDHLCKVLAGYSIFTIDIRGESFHLPVLLESVLKYLHLRGRKKLTILYYSIFLDRLSARICITNQDANAIFFDLEKENKNIRFIALQQGLKVESTISNFSEISGDYYAYGSAYADKLNNGKANIIIAGSLKANNAEFERGKYDRLSYISGFVGHPLATKIIGNYNYAEFSYPSIYNGLGLADGFCTKNKIDLIVVSKSSREQTELEKNHVMQNEIQLYTNILGRDAVIVAGDSYKVAGESRLIICDQSALGYELLGMGCKVVFLSFIAHFLHQPSYHFGWPLELPSQGPFWSSIPDPSYIEDMLEKVWEMPPDEWDEIAKPYREKLMVYDKGNTILHRQLKTMLDS